MTRVAAFLTTLAALALLLSGPGTRMGWWHFRSGLLMFAASGLIAVLAAIVALLAWVRARSAHQRRASTVLITLVSLAIAGFIGMTVMNARKKPPIHDISTDLNDPPQFSRALPQPDQQPDQQRAAYPDIAPIGVKGTPREAFERSFTAAKDLGWKITSSNPDAGIIEATDTTTFFGFKDDVVIRVRAYASGTTVDVRSVSQVGKSDVGANAERIRKFRERLQSMD